MFRLARLLTALLAFTLLAATSASAITAVSAEKPTSGLFGALKQHVRIDALASSDRVDEKLSLLCDFASDFSVAARGTTVLGKFPEYIKLADEIGAKRFNIPSSVWNRMSSAEQWAANKKFLDRAISRGDDILLSYPVRNINDVTGAFRQELDYLISNGFRLSADGTRLVR